MIIKRDLCVAKMNAVKLVRKRPIFGFFGRRFIRSFMYSTMYAFIWFE